jgi:hypothetical protein
LILVIRLLFGADRRGTSATEIASDDLRVRREGSACGRESDRAIGKDERLLGERAGNADILLDELRSGQDC